MIPLPSLLTGREGGCRDWSFWRGSLNRPAKESPVLPGACRNMDMGIRDDDGGYAFITPRGHSHSAKLMSGCRQIERLKRFVSGLFVRGLRQVESSWECETYRRGEAHRQGPPLSESHIPCRHVQGFEGLMEKSTMTIVSGWVSNLVRMELKPGHCLKPCHRWRFCRDNLRNSSLLVLPVPAVYRVSQVYLLAGQMRWRSSSRTSFIKQHNSSKTTG